MKFQNHHPAIAVPAATASGSEQRAAAISQAHQEIDAATKAGVAGAGLVLIGVAFAAFFGLTALSGGAIALAICPPIALGVTGISIFIAGRYMPSKTEAGAAAAANWLAFKKYLEDIEHYTNLEEATGIFEKYLAYAVAFGALPAFVTLGLPERVWPPPWAVAAGVPSRRARCR